MIMINKIRDYLQGNSKPETVVQSLQANNLMEAPSKVEFKIVKSKSGKAFRQISIDCEELQRDQILELVDLGFVTKKMVYLEEYYDE